MMERLYTPKAVSSASQSKKRCRALAGGGGTRKDGRRREELRQILLETGVVGAATGSAYIEMDKTKVIVAVHGPHELAAANYKAEFSEEGKLRCSLRFAPFSKANAEFCLSDQPSEEERDMAELIRCALEGSVRLSLLTKSALDLHIVVLAADGGELAASITAASLALADSGVELLGLVSACSIFWVADDDLEGGGLGKDEELKRLLADPTSGEIADLCGGSMTVAVLGSTGEVTQWHLVGRLKGRRLSHAVDMAVDGCSSVHELMRSALITEAAKKLPLQG